MWSGVQGDDIDVYLLHGCMLKFLHGGYGRFGRIIVVKARQPLV